MEGNDDDKARANQGKKVMYEGKIHYIVYETNKFVIISKSKHLTKKFSVKPNKIKYE